MQIEIPTTLIDAVRQARHLAVLTGAGVSAESGVPTFRDAQTGLWAQFNPQELATREAFARNPKMVWEWYAHRRELVGRAEPNAGHYALAELENRCRSSERVAKFTLITQNIDGLHARAGSKNIIELHGNIFHAKCFREDTRAANWLPTDEIPPRCPRCGSYMRPDVVWFGEALPRGALDESFRAAERCDVFFSIGTSGAVEPAASLPFVALQHGAVVIEVNPEETPLSASATFCLRAPSAAALTQLLAALGE